ncbi:DUF4231 domain-containing protein [Nocardia takedensis]|uniref:DUF4231 domain-containing protein n=1 Tax=Nocardia takedensis TaxID=259390 RepID=UPI0009FC065C
MSVAEESHNWYQRAAINSRLRYRFVEVAQLTAAALIPLSPIVLDGNTVVPAILGATIVVLTGIRSIFHWNENYLRFSQARELVQAARRAYAVGAAPYSDPTTRDEKLVAAVTAIEQSEMGAWLEIAGARRARTDQDSRNEASGPNDYN